MSTTQTKQPHRKKATKSVWKFVDAPNFGVYTTKRIMAGQDPITRVYHDAEDGAWQFHGPRKSKREDAVLVCLQHIVDMDHSISELSDLPLGWCALRKNPSSPWKRETQEPRGQ